MNLIMRRGPERANVEHQQPKYIAWWHQKTDKITKTCLWEKQNDRIMKWVDMSSDIIVNDGTPSKRRNDLRLLRLEFLKLSLE